MKRFFAALLTVFFFLCAAGAAGIFALYLWAERDLPNMKRLEDYRPPLTTTVLARDGSVLGTFARENRYLLRLEEMPPFLPKAFLAAEDAGFYEHEGIDPIAILRALINNIQSGSKSQGGSTITQQVIKRLLLTPERSYERKIKEAILAYRLERHLSKDEILTIYLNHIFLGSNAYGVEAAARTYFGKHARDLNIAECAVLAGLPQAPSRYNPYREQSAAIVRQHYVLRRLKELHWITDAQYDEAMRAPLTFRAMPSAQVGRECNWYLEEVRRRIIALFDEKNAEKIGMKLPFYGERAVYELGLTVRTALEPQRQAEAADALRHGLERICRQYGWRGPIRNVPEKERKNYGEKNGFSRKTFENGGTAKGMVTAVEAGRVHIAFGEGHVGILHASHVGLIRRYNAKTGAPFGVRAGDLRNIFHIGDELLLTAAPDRKPAAGRKEEIHEPIQTKLLDTPDLQGALVSIEPDTGDVVAMIGGYDFGNSQFNRATQAYRQPGSTFKPIVYSAALDEGFTPASILQDAPFVEHLPNGREWRPSNYGNSYSGPILLRTALALSKNLCTVRVAKEIGVFPIIQRAKDLELEPNFPQVLAISLGAVAVTPLNLTQAYTAFARGGVLSKARFILSVEDFSGNILYSCEPDLRDAISPQNAYLMTYLLKEVVNAGTGGRAKALNRPVGGKTGTSNDEHDAWFMGITPHLVTGVFVGFDNNRSMGRIGSGSSAALPVFVEYASSALKAYPSDDFDVPEGIEFASVNRYSGRKTEDGVADSLRMPFYEGTVPGSATLNEDISSAPSEELMEELF
ncbi:MAG: PBP1A family penicillin-binding protein [Desulfovibrionaceae bacterium]|nr:PBP1A family penicillin-binding protein [Desulfovibrionaceae bacterium]